MATVDSHKIDLHLLWIGSRGVGVTDEATANGHVQDHVKRLIKGCRKLPAGAIPLGDRLK